MTMAMRQTSRPAKPHHQIDISLFVLERLSASRGESELSRADPAFVT
jgi:hypothetical protein